MPTLMYNKLELEEKICAALGLDPASVQTLSIHFEAGEPVIDIHVTLVADPKLEAINWEQVIPAASVSVFIQRPGEPDENPVWIPRPSKIKMKTASPEELAQLRQQLEAELDERTRKLKMARGIPLDQQQVGDIKDYLGHEELE